MALTTLRQCYANYSSRAVDVGVPQENDFEGRRQLTFSV